MGKRFDKDLDLAQRVCRELAKGNNKAILELYSLYQNLFFRFAMRRLFSPTQNKAERILSDFWLELLNGKALQNYAGKASLSTYLLVILNRRILDHNARFAKRRERFVQEPNPDSNSGLQESPEETLIRSQREKVLTLALAALDDISPRDARLIRMHLAGLNYEQMAERELQGETFTQEELHKKTNALKKQFSRPGTGSLAKFKTVLTRALQKYGLTREDLLE
ncbi:RNA polymerase sigma-70 factor, ECF subfamily [Desulfatibacillum alkenivorans DSM 16219]|jgi:RNA polymerase sigma-70 factor (ECF subfamily)|uniref:RNA polymerase sigma-70 factor, ECF subfamily n=1 Tax=Desulfatibacillum alkenivorans DSM 16219 TaxID=1121393 RepID=A0A1M6FJF0_9BACT|nr:sigma-70 family RNA polymerase sigma factor [Desulfatibacillum alkenivorans]SHI97742.1 RNA polymerase sigma-70 factor, ECF subfamily [Desulfatibacillum alkenivorans DSM 16219]